MHNFKDLPKSCDICSGDVLSTQDIVDHIRKVRPDARATSWNAVTSGWTGSRARSSGEDYFGDPSYVKSLPLALTSLEVGVKELISFYESASLDPKEFVY